MIALAQIRDKTLVAAINVLEMCGICGDSSANWASDPPQNLFFICSYLSLGNMVIPNSSVH